MTLDDLKAQRADIPEDDALPASTTRGDLRVIQERRLDLDRRILAAETALQALDTYAPDEADAQWHAHLTAARAVLATELLALPSHTRDPRQRGLFANLSLSIRVIDAGLGIVAHTGYDLTNLRLGELLRESGYQLDGADPLLNYVGTMPWHGSLPEVEARIAKRAQRCAQAQSSLDDALLDDDVRAEREAEAKARRDALNAEPVLKERGDGSKYMKFPDGRRVEVTTS